LLEFLTSNAIALAAGFISLLALVATVYHGVATRNHFHLSIKPQLSVDFGIIPNENLFHITITNQGLGPAIIKTFSIIEEGKEIHPDNPSSFIDIIEKQSKNLINHSEVNLPHINESLIPNKAITLIKLTLNPMAQKEFGTYATLKQLIPFEIKIEYESMYGEKDSLEIPPKFTKK